jgi:hypothetical protein
MPPSVLSAALAARSRSHWWRLLVRFGRAGSADEASGYKGKRGGPGQVHVPLLLDPRIPLTWAWLVMGLRLGYMGPRHSSPNQLLGLHFGNYNQGYDSPLKRKIRDTPSVSLKFISK